MKLNLTKYLTLVTLAAALPLTAKATIFFSDNFTNGSTLNSATPANPTTTNTAYEIVASKSWSPAPSLTSRDLKFGIVATTSGYIQAEALFATNAVALTQPGDFIQLTVVFTNTTGLLTVAGQLGFGLYNSGQVKPVAGGINNSLPATFAGAAQNWQGYVGLINQGTATSRILSRPTQTGLTLASQDLVTIGTSSSMASSVIGTAVAVGQTLTAGSTYTEVLTLTLVDASNLAITNTLYAGPDTTTVLTNFGAVAAAPFIAGGFDALAIGYCGRANSGGNPLIDISSIQVTGAVTTVSGGMV